MGGLSNVFRMHSEWIEIMPVQCDDGLAWCVTKEQAAKLASEASIGDFFATEEQARAEAALWHLPVRVIGLEDAGRVQGSVSTIVAG